VGRGAGLQQHSQLLWDGPGPQPGLFVLWVWPRGALHALLRLMLKKLHRAGLMALLQRLGDTYTHAMREFKGGRSHVSCLAEISSSASSRERCWESCYAK